MMENAGNIRKRKGNPKSRSGCKTCKVRRIKCDETKPQCIRCVQFIGHCGGYNSGKDVEKRTRTLLPVTQKEVIREVTKPVFQDDQEYQYFQTFIQEVAPRTTISGTFNVAGLFTTLVPQACWEEPALRHGFVALGALSLTQPYCQSTTSNRSDATRHYTYALARYQKALKSMSSLHSLRAILISIILIFCFESGTDRLDLACKQLLTGFTLLWRWLKSFPTYGQSTTSPSPSIIDHDLIKLNRSMSVHIWTVKEAKSIGLPKNFPNDEWHLRVEGMLENFETMDEARHFLEATIARTLHYVQALAGLQPEEERPVPKSYFRIFHDAYLPTSEMPPEYQEEHREFIDGYKRWFQASTALWEHGQTERGRLYNRIAGMRATAHVGAITQAGTEIPSQCDFDIFLPLFQEIVLLLRNILDSLDAHGLHDGQELELGVIMPLFYVAIRCTDRATCREAIALLRKANRKEGIWDSSVTALVAEYLMDIEEAGVAEDGALPQKKWICLRGIAVNSRRKKVFVKWLSYMDGERVCMEDWISW